MTQISIRLPDADTAAIDELVDAGRYANRTAFVADAVHAALDEVRERQVAEAYRRAYADHPEDDAAQWAVSASQRAFERMEPDE